MSCHHELFAMYNKSTYVSKFIRYQQTIIYCEYLNSTYVRKFVKPVGTIFY